MTSHKVCHISTVHPASDQRIAYRECWSLAAAGYETHLIAPAVHSMATADGVRLHCLGAPASERLSARLFDRCLRVVRAARLATAVNASIYHLHDPELIPLGLYLKASTKGAVIFDSHEDNVAYLHQKPYLPGSLRWVLSIAMRVLERLASRFFDAIITADDGVAALFSKRLGAKRVVTLYNFPRLDLFAHSDRPSEPAFDLVYHGSMPRYHLEEALAIAEALRAQGVEARWLFFGSCPEIEWATAEIYRRNLQDTFVLDPVPIPHDQVAARVRQARIGIIPLPDLPKFRHNIPTKLFEYMALAIPVVLSDLPPSRPFVFDGGCATMVKPGDYLAYAGAIAELLSDPAVRVRMGLEGHRRVVQHYNWATQSSRLLSLYEELLRNHVQLDHHKR